MKLVRFSYIIFFIFTILCLYAINLSNSTFWFLSVLTIATLPCLLINLLYFFYFFLRKHYKWVFFSILLFCLGFKHINKTIQIGNKSTSGEIKVLNSNVRIFNVYRPLRDKNKTSSKEMIKWIANSDADVLILQEYYNLDTSKVWASNQIIGKKFPYSFLEISLYNKIKAEFGQVIFSKYPIINKGKIKYDNKTFNQAIFADIVKNKDTIRFYNIHLQSMAIEERKLFNDKYSENEIKHKVKDTSFKLLKGLKLRQNQIKNIISHIKKSPYPIILGVDMNDTPYSYAYHEFAKYLNNSFEEKGNGFGFTFNGKLFFLRIDNLFSSTQFEVNSFQTHREIPYSDHFPISASYSLKK